MIGTASDRVCEGIAVDIGGSDVSHSRGVFIDSKFHYPNQFWGIVNWCHRYSDGAGVSKTAIRDRVGKDTKGGGVIIKVGIGGKHQTGELGDGQGTIDRYFSAVSQG